MKLIRKPKKSSTTNTWVTPEMFGKAGKGTVTLLGPMRASNSQYGESIDFDVKVNGSKCSWTVKYDTPNYSKLHDRFGNEEGEWKGPVQVEVKKHMGKKYIAVI